MLRSNVTQNDANVPLVTLDARLTLPEALQYVANETGMDLRHATARVGVGRGHLLEIVIQSGDFYAADEPRALAACRRLVELLLGTDTLRTWLGKLGTVPGPKMRSLRMASADLELFQPLQQLVAAVDAGCAGILAGLDERPYHTFCEHGAWTLLDVEPVVGAEPCVDQDDLVLCSTLLPEMMKCFLQKDPFSSCRFSRHGELFVYLKYLGSQTSDSEMRLAERMSLEDALNRALVPGAMGCVVGAGLGTRHGYIDLALTELEHAIPLVRLVWQRWGGEGCAWLQFCDSERQHHWVAISEAANFAPRAGPPGCNQELHARSRVKGAQAS
jgi:hypothetical protein